MKSHECHPDELRERALAGDPTLLEDLFNCYKVDLLALLHHRCGGRVDAEDAIQDAFVAAAQYLSGYRGEAQLKTWLYRLASSACTRMRRGQKNDPRIRAPLDDVVETSVEIPGERMELAIESQLRPLKRAIEQLKPVDRSVLLLRDGEGMSTREVADALKLTEASVKSRLHRTRRTVKEVLSEQTSP